MLKQSVQNYRDSVGQNQAETGQYRRIEGFYGTKPSRNRVAR